MFTWMPSKNDHQIHLLQGTLDVLILRILATMGSQHSYGISGRLEQLAEQSLSVNQGTLYPALVRLEQNGWITGTWRKTENNRDAKYYSLTRTGKKALEAETHQWCRSACFVNKVLLEEL